ncbi:MAG: hypothetical protein ABL888_23395, partial [Pirellulaceae bacterium]
EKRLMQVRQQKRLLALLVLGIACAIVGAIAWPYYVPLDITSSKELFVVPTKLRVAKVVSAPTQADFENVWNLPLRRLISDVQNEQPSPANDESPAVSKPEWKLISVFWKEASPAESLATIQTGPTPSEREYVRVGDTFLTGKVIKISESSVVVSVGGHEFEFALGDQ